MATRALNVGYHILGDTGASAQEARTVVSGTPNGVGGNQNNAMQYFQGFEVRVSASLVIL